MASPLIRKWFIKRLNVKSVCCDQHSPQPLKHLPTWLLSAHIFIRFNADNGFLIRVSSHTSSNNYRYKAGISSILLIEHISSLYRGYIELISRKCRNRQAKGTNRRGCGTGKKFETKRQNQKPGNIKLKTRSDENNCHI
jgi:hypothetical protein